MATQLSIPATTEVRYSEPAEESTRKGRSWGDPGIRETLRTEREQKTTLAKAFLDRAGRR